MFITVVGAYHIFNYFSIYLVTQAEVPKSADPEHELHTLPFPFTAPFYTKHTKLLDLFSTPKVKVSRALMKVAMSFVTAALIHLNESAFATDYESNIASLDNS